MITDSENSDFNNGNGHVIFNEQFDFESHSLIEVAMAVEFELTGIDVKKVKAQLALQHIVIKSKLSGFAHADQDKLNELINIIYQQQGFSGDWQAFFEVENALISRVLARRKGIPISMGVVMLDILEVCGFKAQGICFPSGFIVSISLANEVVYFDPFAGELLSRESLELKVRGQLGNHARLTSNMLKPDTNKTIMKRLITVIKAAYLQADALTLALLCSDILLRIDPDDAYEVRDRGFIFEQLDCFKLASNDFEFFIEKFPEDPIVFLLKQQIKKMDIEKNTQIIH